MIIFLLTAAHTGLEVIQDQDLIDHVIGHAREKTVEETVNCNVNLFTTHCVLFNYWHYLSDELFCKKKKKKLYKNIFLFVLYI